MTWTNDSDAPHTVDSDSGGELESGNFTEGQTFEHTFNATGTFAYHCDIHEYMKGTVVVLAAGVTAPPTSTAPAPTAPAEPAWLGIALLVLASLVASGAGASEGPSRVVPSLPGLRSLTLRPVIPII